MSRFKVAIVGLGKMGLLHASILNSMSNVEVIGLCDKSYLLKKLVRKLFKKAEIVNDVEKFSNLDLDSIYVTTPIPSHFPIIKTILEKNLSKNIFVEKTLALNFDESKILSSLVKNNNGANMVGYMKRFAVTFVKAKDLLDKAVLGRVISFDAYAYSSDFSRVDSVNQKSASRGGVLSDLGSHVIDLGLWFFGDFEVVSSLLKSVNNGISEDSAQFTVRKLGLKGHFHISWLMENYRMPNFGISIKGENGIMKINDYNVKLKLNNGELHEWFKHDLDDHVDFLLGESEYYREDEAFITSACTSKKVEPSFSTASKVDYIIDRVKKEAKKN